MKTINKKDDKMFETYNEIKVKCKHCGHTNKIPVYVDTQNCWFCHIKLQNNTKSYFKYKMRKLMR